jgi:hypothetical protein
MSSILSYKACSILETKSSLYALPWNFFIKKENQEGEEEEEENKIGSTHFKSKAQKGCRNNKEDL